MLCFTNIELFAKLNGFLNHFLHVEKKNKEGNKKTKKQEQK